MLYSLTNIESSSPVPGQNIKKIGNSPATVIQSNENAKENSHHLFNVMKLVVCIFFSGGRNVLYEKREEKKKWQEN